VVFPAPGGPVRITRIWSDTPLDLSDSFGARVDPRGMLSRMSESEIHLRPFRESDLEYLDRFSSDPSFSEPFLWFGFRHAEGFRRRWREDGLLESDPRMLIVAHPDDEAMGWVSWRQGALHARAASFEIGAFLFPEHRGRGVGTAAQRKLVEHLFRTNPIHRVWAGTGPENLVEQKALEHCGFVREGVLRQEIFRSGAWHDSVIYGLLRHEL
jgi:ribosomal-protein-alanine N-acetyltransferase